MIHEDFLMRQIRGLAAAIAQALGLRQAGEATAARQRLDEGSQGLLGLDLTTLSQLPLATLRDLLDDGSPEGALRLSMAASLLAEAAVAEPRLADRARALLAAVRSDDPAVVQLKRETAAALA